MPNNPQTIKRYAESHKEQLRESARRYREAHKEQIAQYRIQYYEKNKDRMNIKSKERYVEHKDIKRAQQLKYNARIKSEFLDMYGGVCRCCGETIVAFLTIEHKDGQIRNTKETGTRAYRKAIKEFRPDLYEILCWNCNCAKGQLGYCPHHPEVITDYKIHNSNIPYNYTKEVDSLGRKYK